MTRRKKALSLAALLAAALLSVFVLSRPLTTPATYQKTLDALEEKQTTVLELTAASAAASAGLSMLPGDTATPIAKKLIDLSGYFLIALCAIYLEKYLLTVTGFAACMVLFPLACCALAVYVCTEGEGWKAVGKKLAVFGVAICLVVPVSEGVSGLIQRTYDASMRETISLAQDAAQGTAGSTEEGQEDNQSSGGLLSGLYSKITDTVKEGVSGLVQKAENLLSRFVEALAVTLITCCAIPVLVILFFGWLMKLVLGLDIRRKRQA